MRGTSILRLACVLALAPPLRAEGPVIDHSAVACMAAERFPRLEARFAEPDAISRARVQFRGEGGPWYFVEMKPSGGVFTAVLPKPKKSLKTVGYYIEATDRQFRVNRTQEFSATVVPQAAMCADKKMMAEVVTTASVVVGSPAGAAGVPAGFSSAGVASAAGSTAAAGASAGSGGGIGTAATVGIIAGGAAIAGIAVAATSGGDSGPTTTTAVAISPTATNTTLPPPPATLPSGGSGTPYTGPFSGQRTVGGIAAPGGCESTTSAFVGTLTITLPSSGDASAGRGVTVGTATVVSNTGNCNAVGNRPGDATPFSWNLPLSGTPGNLAFGATQDSGGIQESIAFSGALSGSVLSGVLTFSVSGLGRSGTTSIPVTLR